MVDLLGPDGPHGWPSAEGLGLAAPADLWTMPAALEPVGAIHASPSV